ncbi:SDR family NAD(P)-dependent oxidoreductase [Lichenihabitans sp. PAMC28606]|uniref:SDR family NAD(P)-dependent oxidoreductase n=1 Tax=Lichenihabitans sp. PAMC28606 TaxID=2880932 RepID=UPI001D0A32D9|nr:SDR family NAD(P)-dependent oxidoreductase [Lichenihabitans sp. PAMC28606]UDL95778.1 SDR family NAD(P)-dependent oxidoreductase [Lichenihabitans sp. PAMC28606]
MNASPTMGKDRQGSMVGKTVVMTGATSGLGAVAAETLARRGAKVVVVARDAARGARTMARLTAANPNVTHRLHLGDLSRLTDMKRVGAEIAEAEPIVHVLANNAGAMFKARQITEDGLERTFATNHMAYLVLTLGLKASLEAAGGARVVNTASAAHRGQRFNPADMQSLKNYSGPFAYGRSKLYNILFTRELARRWAGTGVTVNCFHPGVVATRFGDDSGGWLALLARAVKTFAITPEQGAQTLIYLAASRKVAGITGEYFDRCAVIEARPSARDDAAAAALFTASMKLAGLPD